MNYSACWLFSTVYRVPADGVLMDCRPDALFLTRRRAQFDAEVDVVDHSGLPFAWVLRGVAPTDAFAFGGFGWRLS